ncbi:MAG: cytochrome c biogenesis protein ResB [Candidatus Methanoperedens sp.]|nr:cytochrome c biogenesis protein ResB [Candidatus Methanoperedens sp.]
MDTISDFSPGKKISSFFQSRKLAVILISSIILVSIIGTHIPQKSQLKPEVYNAWKTNHPTQAEIFDFLGFTNMFSSAVFIGLCSLLFLNTSFCTRNMLVSALRKLKRNQQFQNKDQINGLETRSEISTAKEDKIVISHIDSVLQSHGYRLSLEGNKIFAEKNRYGVFGVPLFHICILFIILATVYGSLGRMEGDMRLIEGQSLQEDHGNYMFINEGPLFYENHQKFDIKLDKFYPDYIDSTDTPRGAAGKLIISENGNEMKTDIVYSNNLVTYRDYTFLGNVYGMAPLLVLMNPDGTIYSGSYITASDPDSSGRYVASFDMADTGLEGGLMVYMTAPLTGIEESGNTKQTPIMFMKIFDQGEEIYDGTLRLNDTVKIPWNNMYLGFYDIKYWSNFYVVKDNGTLLVYAGLGLITLSLTIIFFVIPKRVWVEVVKDGADGATEIYIGGRADKFRSLYNEEFSDIIDKIKERLSNVTD